MRLRLERVTAAELVQQTQRELIDLLAYEQASLALAQRCSGVSASMPLFTALLNYRHAPPHGDQSTTGWFIPLAPGAAKAAPAKPAAK